MKLICNKSQYCSLTNCKFKYPFDSTIVTSAILDYYGVNCHIYHRKGTVLEQFKEDFEIGFAFTKPSQKFVPYFKYLIEKKAKEKRPVTFIIKNASKTVRNFVAYSFILIKKKLQK
jgi:hypothetical protein